MGTFLNLLVEEYSSKTESSGSDVIPDLGGSAPLGVDACLAAAESNSHYAYSNKLPPHSRRSYDERANKTQKLVKAVDYENYPDISFMNVKGKAKGVTLDSCEQVSCWLVRPLSRLPWATALPKAPTRPLFIHPLFICSFFFWLTKRPLGRCEPLQVLSHPSRPVFPRKNSPPTHRSTLKKS